MVTRTLGWSISEPPTSKRLCTPSIRGEGKWPEAIKVGLGLNFWDLDVSSTTWGGFWRLDLPQWPSRKWQTLWEKPLDLREPLWKITSLNGQIICKWAMFIHFPWQTVKLPEAIPNFLGRPIWWLATDSPGPLTGKPSCIGALDSCRSLKVDGSKFPETHLCLLLTCIFGYIWYISGIYIFSTWNYCRFHLVQLVLSLGSHWTGLQQHVESLASAQRLTLWSTWLGCGKTTVVSFYIYIHMVYHMVLFQKKSNIRKSHNEIVSHHFPHKKVQ